MHRSRLSSRRVATLTACAVGVAVLTGACGASGGDDEPQGEPAPAISIPADLSMSGAAASEESSDEAGDQESDGEESGAAEAQGEQLGHERCAELQQAWAASNRALVDLSAQHPRALVESIRTAEEATTSAEPTEDIAAAWGTRSDYLGSVVEAFDGIDEDDADAVSSAFADAVDGGDTQVFNDAADEISDYLDATCSGR